MNESTKTTILFHPYMAPRVENLVVLANELKSAFNILFIVPDESYTPLLIENHLEYICIHCKSSKFYHNQSFSQRLIRNPYTSKILNWIKPFSIGQLIWQQLFYNNYCYYYKILKNILQIYNIKIIITINDRHYFPIEMALLKISRELSIKVVIPFIMQYVPDTSYQMIKNNKKYLLTKESSLLQKIIYKKYAYLTYKGHHFYPPFLYIALKRFGTLSNQPWINGGGISDKIIVANELSKKIHIRYGISNEKIHILGDVTTQQVYDSYNNRNTIKKHIYQKYNLNPNKKLIIIALSNLWEHNLADKNTHFEIIYHTLDTCIKFQNSHNILILLHPSMKRDNYTFLERKYAIHIVKEKTMCILPIADLYISNYSSTVVWSILCNIKTLIIGYYNSFNIYDELQSIVQIKNKDHMTQSIQQLIYEKKDFSNDHYLLSKDIVFNNSFSLNYIHFLKELLNS